MYNLPTLNQEEMENTHYQYWNGISNLKKKSKSPESESFIGEFYQTFKEALTPIIPKLFQKILEECMLPNSFYKAKLTLIQNLYKEGFYIIKKIYGMISLVSNDVKILNKIIEKQIQQYSKIIIYHD